MSPGWVSPGWLRFPAALAGGATLTQHNFAWKISRPYSQKRNIGSVFSEQPCEWHTKHAPLDCF